LKPYFLTVAKRIKEYYPDVILEKVLLPKVEKTGASDSDNLTPPTFEVVVDGKVIIRTPSSRNTRSLGSLVCVFVSMEELDVAISRSRRRRRPSTVYGGEEGKEGNVALEVLKTKTRKSLD
jgi:hypothetical protein